MAASALPCRRWRASPARWRSPSFCQYISAADTAAGAAPAEANDDCDPLSRALSINAQAAASRFEQFFKQAFKQPSLEFGIARTMTAGISSFRRRQIYNRRRKE